MNTQNITTQGTSPEVLQHYLTAGIPMLTPEGIGKFIGLSSGRWQNPVEVDLPSRDDGNSFLGGLVCFEYRDCMPILLPFSALTEQLPDGTIPALRAMSKLPLGEEIDWARATAKLWQPGPNRWPDAWVISLFAPIAGEEKAGFALHLASNWTLTGGEATWQRLYLNALLAEHAAVGLEPHQYLAKSSAAVPTIEKTEAAG